VTGVASGPDGTSGTPGAAANRVGATGAHADYPAERSGNGLARPKPTIAELGIDLAALRWHRSGPGAGSFEVAFVGTAGDPQPGSGAASKAGYPTDASAEWVLLRVAGDPAARVLIYDRVEWESFVDGAAKGEFDDAAGPGLFPAGH
jgi:hypothetical protein